MHDGQSLGLQFRQAANIGCGSGAEARQTEKAFCGHGGLDDVTIGQGRTVPEVSEKISTKERSCHLFVDSSPNTQLGSRSDVYRVNMNENRLGR